MVQRSMAHSGRGGVRFDIDHRRAQYNTAPLQSPQAGLPLTLVDAIATDSTGSAYPGSAADGSGVSAETGQAG